MLICLRSWYLPKDEHYRSNYWKIIITRSVLLNDYFLRMSSFLYTLSWWKLQQWARNKFLQKKLLRNDYSGSTYALLRMLTGKNCVFGKIQYMNGWLAASDLFNIFTQSIKFCYTFHYHVWKYDVWKKVRMFEKCDSSNRY